MNRIQLLFFFSVISFFNSSHAADTYSASNNTLTIPLVKVSSAYYANVQITVGSVVSVGSQDPTAPAYDVYNTSNNQLTIPEVVVGGTSYYNVVITVGSVLSVGASCSTAAQCSTDVSSTDDLYFGPAQYSSVIEASYTPGTMVLASALTNRSRYLFSNASSQTTSANYLQVGSTYDATNGFAVEAGTLASSTN
jgi:hypothetical protein